MERMKPEKAAEILRKNGLQVSIEEAEIVLEFVYAMAPIAMVQSLRGEGKELTIFDQIATG